MPKLSDVGKTIQYTDGRKPTVSCKVIMGIKSPKGTCFIYDSIEDERPHTNMDIKVKAVQAFMEFSNG